MLLVQFVTKRIFYTSFILYFLSQILFLVNIQFPVTHNFDEFHYVPAAKNYLEMKENRNWEHPPLGKLLIATSIAIWGDRPIGWRFMSTVFGSLTLVGMYFLSLSLFRRERIAIWVALLTLFNQLLYVQSRIGMLDTFMFAFLVWGLAAFCATWNPKFNLKQTRQLLLFTGLMFGLSMACKWFTIVPWVACILLIFLIRILQNWETTFKNPQKEDWYHPELWKEIRWPSWILCLGVVPIGVYLVTFIPLLWIEKSGHSLMDLFSMQLRMWSGQLRVLTAHPYMSGWTEWPLLTRPMWYAFDRDKANNDWVRGVMLLGNPLIMWAGLIALLRCARDFIVFKNRVAFSILFFYFIFLGCWIIIPRKIAFYYYYYPAGMILSLALGYFFHQKRFEESTPLIWIKWIFLGMSLSLFIYFFPILAAIKIPTSSYRNWMWFPRWI